MLKKLEDKLGNLFGYLPVLPESSREEMVRAWPIVTLVLAGLQLWTVWALWSVKQAISSFYDKYPVAYGGTDTLFIYGGIILALADALLLCSAYPALKKRSRRGWKLLFVALLVNAGTATLSLFIRGRGVGAFLLGLLGCAVGFYLLFQVRGKYGKVK